MIYNNVCYHCGTPLVYGRWQVNVFKTEEFAPPKSGAMMFICPKCDMGWEVIHTNAGLAYPSFMADGHEWRGPINRGPAVQSSKDAPVTSRWIPVNDRSPDFAADLPYYDAASHSSLIHVTCACGKDWWLAKSADDMWACGECGRVYRVQARFWVEQHMGGGR